MFSISSQVHRAKGASVLVCAGGLDWQPTAIHGQSCTGQPLKCCTIAEKTTALAPCALLLSVLQSYLVLKMPPLVSVLQGLPLLSSLPQVTVAHLAQFALERVYAKREIVLQKGGAPTHLCFLLEGRLQGVDFTMDDREVGLYFINPGDYFGEVALVDSQTEPEFVTAVARSRVVLIPRDMIKHILFASPKLAETLCVRLAVRLRSVSAQRRILGLSNPLQRVCAQLELLCDTQGLATGRIPNAPTHQELAIMVNASRETVTRVFQLLQSRGVVERDGNDLRLQDAQFIRQVAAGKTDIQK